MTAVNSRNPARSLGERVLRRHLGRATEAAAMARSAGSALAMALRIQRKVSRAASLRPLLVAESADNTGRFAGEVEARFPLVQRKFVRRAMGESEAAPVSDASAESSPLPQDDAPPIQRSIETNDADEADVQPIRLPSMSDIRERIRRSQAAASSPEAQAPADAEPPVAAEPQPRTMDEVRQRIQRSTAAAASGSGVAPSAPAAPQAPAADPSPRSIARQARRRATIEEITPSAGTSVQRDAGEPTSLPRERRISAAEAAGSADSDEGDAAASAPVIQRTFDASRPAMNLPARTSDERTQAAPTEEATRSDVEVRVPLQSNDAADTVHRAVDDMTPSPASGVAELLSTPEPSVSQPVVTTPRPSLDPEHPLRRQAGETDATQREASGNPPSQVAPLAAQPASQASTNIQRDIAENAPTLSVPARPVASLSEATSVAQRMEVPADSLPAGTSAQSVEAGSASDIRAGSPDRAVVDTPQAHGAEPTVQRRIATNADTTSHDAPSHSSESSAVPQSAFSPVADVQPTAEIVIRRSPETETVPRNERSQPATEPQPETRVTVQRRVDQPRLVSDVQPTLPAGATPDRIALPIEGTTPVEMPHQPAGPAILRAVLSEPGESAPAATAAPAPSETTTSTKPAETLQRSVSPSAQTSRSETPVVSLADEPPVTRALATTDLPPAILRQASDIASVSTSEPTPSDQPAPSSEPGEAVAGELSATSPMSAPSIQRMVSQPLPLRAPDAVARHDESPTPVSGTASMPVDEPVFGERQSPAADTIKPLPSEPAVGASTDMLRRLPITDADQTPTGDTPDSQRTPDVREQSEISTSHTPSRVLPDQDGTSDILRQTDTGMALTPPSEQSASDMVSGDSATKQSGPSARSEATHADHPVRRAAVPDSSPRIVQRKPLSEAPQDTAGAPDRDLSAETRSQISVQPNAPPAPVPDSGIQRAPAFYEGADSLVEPRTLPPEHKQQAHLASDRAPAVQRAVATERASGPLFSTKPFQIRSEASAEPAASQPVRRAISARPSSSVAEAPLPYTPQPVNRIDRFRSPLSVQRTVAPAESNAVAAPLPYVPHHAGRAPAMPVAPSRDASAPVRQLAATSHAGEGSGGEPSFAPRQIHEVRYAPRAPRVQRAIDSDAGVEQGGNLDAMPETLNSVSPFEPQGPMDGDRLSMQNLARRVYPFVRALLAAERERRP